MFKKSVFVLTLLGLSTMFSANAQSFVKSKKDNFEWRLRGRVLLDGGAFSSKITGMPIGGVAQSAPDLSNGVSLSDMRIGAAIKFLDNWSATMEVGYSYNKVSLKDVFLKYNFDKNSFQAGYFYSPFGEARGGTTNFRLMSEGSAMKAFTLGRQLGATYQYAADHINVTAGAFSNVSINGNNEGDQGYTLVSKFIGRPVFEDGKVLHLSVAPSFSSPSDEKKTQSFAAGIPTMILSSSDNQFVKANIDNVINSWKFDCEFIGVYNKWYTKANYLTSVVNRFGGENYRAEGVVAEAGYLILGDKQKYNATMGVMNNPAPKSLEVIFRYDYLDLNDRNADILAGVLNDVTIGCSYYINKYVAVRLNYVHSWTGDYANIANTKVNTVQARIQFAF